MSLPPLPDGATLDALPPLPEGATLDAPENTDPASRDVAPSVTGFTAEDVSADVQAADRTARHTRLRLAFDESRRTSEDDAATTLAVAKQLGVPFDNVRKNLPAFKETAAAAQFDPARWEQENPELSKLVLSTPELGPLVLRSKEIGPIVRAFRAAGDWTKDALRAVNEALTVPADTLAEQQAQMQSSDFAAVDPSKLEQANTPLTPEQVADVERQRAQRDAPKLAQEREDPKARLVREDTSFSGRLLLLGLRAAETKQSLDLARKQVRLMLAENGIAGDPAELAAELHDAKLASTPRAYGDDTGLLRDLTEGLQGAVSTVDVGADALKGAGVAGAAGFVATAVPTAVVTKNPGAAVRAGVAGARALAGKGAQTAAFLSAMELETGTSYEALRELTTDAGQKLTPGEAMGGAVVQGLIKGGLEFVSFGQQTKVLKQALPSQITGLITKDPTFRALLRRMATEYGKSVATEGITEGLQDAVEQIGDFVQASMKDEALQKQAYDPTRGLEATQGGVLGALLSGGVTSGLALATTRTTDARTEVADQQVSPLLELAQQPAVKAAPEAFAQLIAETSAEGGHAPLTALHVDAHAVVKYFQEQGFDGQATNAAVAELLGPEAPAKLLDAAATGGKLEVPVEAVLSKWGTSEAGKALVDDTTTDPSALTPRQRAEQKAEIEARAEAIAKEEEAKASEAELLANRTRELEQQLIESGQTKQAAKASAALVRAFSATMAADFDQALSAVFPEAPLAVAKGDEQAVGDAALAQLPTDALQARAETIDVPTRAAELFTDTVSGLRTRRAWDESLRRPGTQVAVITSPDIKALNDHPTGGHDTANELLRLIGGVLGGVDAEAARSGTNFLLHAKNREELRAAVNAVRAALPAGLTVEGAVAPDIDAAFAKLDSTTAEKRAAGKLPGRGATAFDLSQLGPETFSAGKPATPNVSQALLERAARTQGKDFAREAYFDKDVPGVLSKTGFDALGERAWVSAFDLKGLKRINDVFGKLAGNAILKAFGEAAARAGGGDIAFAHLSGDEYAAKHDDRAKLAEFETRLRAELQKVGVSVMFGGAQFELTPDFRSGIGEKTYGRADQDLNARKRAEAAAPNDVQRVRGPDGAAPGDQGGAARGDGGRQAGLDGAQEVTRLKQDTGATPKGYTELPAGRALQSTIRVFLNKSADVSTVVHEAGHAFLEQLFDLAERPDAPQRTKDTAAAALKALGVETRTEVKREHHEKFARAFEKYVFTGEAPSSGLKQVFARFTRWLVAIYRTLTGIPGTELSAELKPVFDAMLATEDQIAALRRKQGPQLTAEQLQVKAEERQAQLEQEADEYREGSHAAQLAAVKDALRAREAWWKKGLQQLEANFADEYEQLPARRAQRLISGEETGEAMVLDRKLVQEVIGELKVPGLKTAETGGVRPSLVAEMAGYASPRAMLAELAGLRSKETWVRAQAEATMRQLHPGILDDLSKFRAMLNDGLRSATEKRLMREVQGLDREALKRAAEKLVERRVVGKLQPGRALAQQRAAAAAKARAMAKGDINATREAAQAELLNHYLHHELTAAAAEVGKVEDLAKRLGKTSARERLGKASPAYRDAADFLRGALGFGDPTPLDAGVLEAVAGQLEGDAVTIGDPDWLAPLRAALSKTQDYRQLTVAELGAVRDALKMIETGARNRTTLLIEGKRVDFEDVKTKVLEEIASTLPERGPVVSEHAKTVSEKIRSRISALDGFLLSPVDLVRDLVGDDQSSTLWRVLVLPMRRAMGFEADLVKQRLEPVLNAFEAMPAEMRAGLNDGIDGRALFPTHISELAPPRYRYELLGLALNAGSESSLEVLLAGRGITLEQMTAALNLLTSEEIAWVNAVHDSIEQMREPAFALEERLTGLRPKAVEARPQQLRNGRLNGGYFPLKAEPGASNVGRRAFGADQLASLTDPTFTRPGTAHGHLKSRTGAVYPVALDPDVLRQHIRQSAHDIAFREVVQNAGRLVLDEEVQAALVERLGPEKTAEFLPWLKDIGGGRGLETNAMMQLFRFLKGNAATALLSGFSTAIGNLANLPAAVTSTKLKSKHLAAGLVELMRSPQEVKARALELSGVLRSMENDTIAGLERELATIHGGRTARANVVLKEIGMWSMRTIDGVVSSAVWMGAHRQALADGMDEKMAVRWADDLLLQVQPSSSPAERAGILRDKGMIGAMTMFYGYLSVAYRANHRIASPLQTQDFQRASKAKKAVIAGAVAGQMLGFWLAFGALGDLLMGRGPEAGDADDDEPDNEAARWANWATRKVVVAPLSLIPVLPVANQVEARILKKQATARVDPMSQLVVQLGQTVDAVAKATDEDAPDGASAKAVAKAGRLLGMLTGAPVRLFEVPLVYGGQVASGERQPQNPGQAIGGLIYGSRDGQPTNVPSALGDAIFGTE